MSAVLKRIAALNRNGSLSAPLRFSEVKSVLDDCGEDKALQILSQLESEGSAASDPAEFILEAAATSSTDKNSKKRKVGSTENTAAAKRVRVLNGSGRLAAPIAYDRVKAPLSSLVTAQAMTILASLEDAADGIPDPTAYIRAAVRGAGGVVDIDELDEIEPEEEDEEMASRKRVKKELGGRIKREMGNDSYGLGGVDAADLTEADRIHRRIFWINKNGGLSAKVDADEVLPALDSIGLRQSMRVLRRLEEAASTVDDPNDFIKDLVARAGWIWSKADVIDDDEKVAKRVAWLNQFGNLRQSIDWAEVADILDGLRVAHAMVLLRELEVNAGTVEDPTDFIKKQVGASGMDDVKLPVVGGDENSTILQRVALINQNGTLAAPIDCNDVGEDLGRISERDAMQILDDIESKGKSVKDPTGYIKFKLKAKLAALGTNLEEQGDDSTKILKRIEWLNDYGGLLKDIDFNRVSVPLSSAGIDHAMTVLKELEDKRSSITNPTSFIMGAIASAASKGPAAVPQRSTGVVRGTGGTGESSLATLSSLVDLLSRRVKKTVKLTDVAGALDALGPDALRVLREMQEKGLGLDDPVSYIRAKAARYSQATASRDEDGEEDEIAKLTKRIQWLNKFGGLAKPIHAKEVLGAFYCLGVPQSMAILRELQEKGARVPDPTKYIKISIQQANGIIGTAAKEELPEEEDDMMDEAAALADDYEEEDADMLAEAAALADDYEDEEWKEAAAAPFKSGKKGVTRVVGGLTGATRLVPPRAEAGRTRGPGVVKEEMEENQADDDATPEEKKKAEKAAAASSSRASAMPITPQEKMLQCRNLAKKCGLDLDELCLKGLARLPFYKVKDLIDDVLLGGRNRTGVSNPSRYLTLQVQKMVVGLGVEQGIAMEMAVGLGVVLNNDALDELASIPRRDSHAIIRELSKNSDARLEPMSFIQAEVERIRASMESKPFGM